MSDTPEKTEDNQHESQPSSPDQDGWNRDQAMQEKNKKTMMYSIGLMMFTFLVFGLGSIPMYRWVCQQLDPGGSSAQNGTWDKYEGVTVDESRTIEVRFSANVQGNLPWKFKPRTPAVEVHPGEKKLVKFESVNLDQNHAITGKAVYDINPPEAGQYFKKIECFCFIQQTLEPGQLQEMPLYFWFEPDVPEHVDKITLAYTFFNADTSRRRDQNRGGAAGTKQHTRNSR